jgi:hypothetical protein
MLSDDESDTLLALRPTPHRWQAELWRARVAESTRPTRVNALPICRVNLPLDPRVEPTPPRHTPSFLGGDKR